MGSNRVFVDSDCLLDVLLFRKPFVLDSRDLLLAAQNHKIELFTSALAIANINYILVRDLKSRAFAKDKIKLLVTVVKILTVESSDISEALYSEFYDFEDAIQNSVARKNNCKFLITRNLKDYKKSDIKILSPKEFWDTVIL